MRVDEARPIYNENARSRTFSEDFLESIANMIRNGVDRTASYSFGRLMCVCNNRILFLHRNLFSHSERFVEAKLICMPFQDRL
jgi:hypothetical protein